MLPLKFQSGKYIVDVVDLPDMSLWLSRMTVSFPTDTSTLRVITLTLTDQVPNTPHNTWTVDAVLKNNSRVVVCRPRAANPQQSAVGGNPGADVAVDLSMAGNEPRASTVSCL